MTPRIIVHKGNLIHVNLKRDLITENELRTMLRKQGAYQMKEVITAFLESDGILIVDSWTDSDKEPLGES